MARLPTGVTYPAIPVPGPTIARLQASVLELRSAVEMLTRQRGGEAAWPLLPHDVGNVARLNYPGKSDLYLDANGQWTAVGAVPAGADGEIQFNDGGAFGSDAALYYDVVNATLGTAGRIIETIRDADNHTMAVDEELVVYTGTGGHTVTLLDAAAHPGRRWTIKNAGTANLTVDGTALGQIFTTSLVNTVTLAVGDALQIVSDGTNWQVV